MKTRPPSPAPDTLLPDIPDLPSADELAALRAWYAGLSSREAVQRFLPNETTQSARGAIGCSRRQLVNRAEQVKRADLVDRLRHPSVEREQHGQAAAQANVAFAVHRTDEHIVQDARARNAGEFCLTFLYAVHSSGYSAVAERAYKRVLKVRVFGEGGCDGMHRVIPADSGAPIVPSDFRRPSSHFPD